MDTSAKMAKLVVAYTLLLFVMSVYGQTTVQIGAMKDNTLYQSSDGSLTNGAGQGFFVGRTQQGGWRRGVIAFDIAANIPAGATIDNVSLTLVMSRTTATAKTVTLQRLLADWGEGTTDANFQEGGGAAATPGSATWIHTFHDANFWSNQGGDFASSVSDSQSVAGNGFYTWGPTAAMAADVAEWLDQPNSNFGWILIGDESANTTAKRFDSRESTTETNRPVLSVTYRAETLVTERPNSNVHNFQLLQNYPNPFNPATVIPFRLQRPASVRLHILTVTGQQIRTLVDDVRTAGDHRAVWDGKDDFGSAVPSAV